MNREARKISNLGLPHRKHDRDLRLPNSYPFKAQAIELGEERAKWEQEQKKQKKEDRRQKVEEDQKTELMEKYQQSTELLENKQIAAKQLTAKQLTNQLKNTIKQAQAHHLKQVLHQAQLLLLILDVRKPILDIHQYQQPSKQKVIVVLNKCDLVEMDVCRAWQKYLEEQKVGEKVILMQHKQYHPTSRNGVWKSSQLEEYLYREYKECKVGVVGMGNTGKKTLLKGLEQVQQQSVDKVNRGDYQSEQRVDWISVPARFSETGFTEPQLVVRHLIQVQEIQQLVKAVQVVLQEQVQQKPLMLMYRIPQYQDHHHFLASIAQQQPLKKGLPDIESAAKLVLTDWMSGRIKYHTPVP